MVMVAPPIERPRWGARIAWLDTFRVRFVRRKLSAVHYGPASEQVKLTQDAHPSGRDCGDTNALDVPDLRSR